MGPTIKTSKVPIHSGRGSANGLRSNNLVQTGRLKNCANHGTATDTLRPRKIYVTLGCFRTAAIEHETALLYVL